VKVLIEKKLIAKLVKIMPVCYGTHSFIAVFIEAAHLTVLIDCQPLKEVCPVQVDTKCCAKFLGYL